MKKDSMSFSGGGWEIKRDTKDLKCCPIIDAHYHIFPRLCSQQKGIDPDLRLKLLQYHSREWNNFWRKDNGLHTDEQFLRFNSNNLADMPKVNFRLTKFGQAEITVNDVNYTMQLYPPTLVDNDAPPERMVAEMNIAGVDIGVLQCDHIYGDLNKYFAEARRQYPGRFIGLAQIWEPEADKTERLKILEQGINEYGNKGIYFSVEPLSAMQLDISLNDLKFDSLWNLVQQLEIPVFWYIDDRTHNRIEMFKRRIAELDEWTQRHPDIPSVITHGLVPAAIIHDIGIPDELIQLIQRSNMLAEILFPAKWAVYPYPEGQTQLKQIRDAVGAEKLIWGSDSPHGMSAWCTYRQSIEFIQLHCAFLTQDEKDLILGLNTANLFGIENPLQTLD